MGSNRQQIPDTEQMWSQVWWYFSSAYNTHWLSLLKHCWRTAIRINHRELGTILNTTATNPLTQTDSTFPSCSSMFQSLISIDQRKLGLMFLPHGSKSIVSHILNLSPHENLWRVSVMCTEKVIRTDVSYRRRGQHWRAWHHKGSVPSRRYPPPKPPKYPSRFTQKVKGHINSGHRAKTMQCCQTHNGLEIQLWQEMLDLS